MSGREEVEYVVARLTDYWGRRTPWQRRLWNPGSIAMLDEVLEASRLLQLGHLRKEGVAELARVVEVQFGRDNGIGPARNAVQKALRAVSTDSDAVRQLVYARASIGDGYLMRWRDAIAAGNAKPSELELVSRVIGAHLLDAGFSPEHLYRWIWAVEAQVVDLPTLFEAAHDLFGRPSGRYSIFVPVMALPRHNQRMPASWLEPAAARDWLADNKPGVRVRHNGAFLHEVEARDPWAAVEQVSDLVQSLVARVAVGLPGNDELRTATNAYVLGSRHEFSLQRPRRQVDVHALSRQGALFDTAHPGLFGRLRSAIDLLASLETGAPGAAVAGGWAAIEALLARSDAPNVSVAQGIALLAACSLPRAELTTLAYSHVTEKTALADPISAAPSNRGKCIVLSEALQGSGAPVLSKASDRAATARVTEVLSSPVLTLERVRSYMETAFRRLYRQRNMVLHAGNTDSVTMIATLRTAPPLVGAAIDRIVHAALQDPPVSAQDLVARASIELQLVGQPGGCHVVDLLGC